jgi:hypothetical protein
MSLFQRVKAIRKCFNSLQIWNQIAYYQEISLANVDYWKAFQNKVK